MDLSPINRTTAAQSVADQLLTMIRAGTFKPGDQLPSDRELMEKLQVGRSSVREALQILATLNVIERVPGQGTFVRALLTSDIIRPDLIGVLIGNTMALELLEARQMIEPATVRLACTRGGESDFEQIEALLNQHRTALQAGEPITQYAAQFHILLAEAAHNRVVVSFMESILETLVHRGRNLEKINNYLDQELEEHQEIFQLVCRGNAEAAAAAMLQHILRSAAVYDIVEEGSGQQDNL
jgi:GntR family transcriptional repressor for pyruvate dehydrogenase complex